MEMTNRQQFSNHRQQSIPSLLPQRHRKQTSPSKPSKVDSNQRLPAPSTQHDTLRCTGACGSGPKNYQLRIAGPSMGGKTSFIKYLLHGQPPTNIPPTNDMEVSNVLWNNNSFIFWDSRRLGEDDLKPAILMTPSLNIDSDKSLIAQRQSFNALVYVVDASDPGRLKIASRDFVRFLQTYHDVPVVLILGTKKDHPRVVDATEIRAQLKVVETAYDRECEVFLVSSSSGEGVHDALEWLTSRLKQREGLLASLIDFFNFRESRRTRTISCGSLGVWDPLSMCRYSRLS